jgi:hypothetical protein
MCNLKDMRIGTWNDSSWESLVVEVMKYSLDIVEIQEVRVPGEERYEKRKYIFYDGKENQEPAF